MPLILTAAFPTSGRADLTTETLIVNDTEVPLDAVSSFRAVSVGPLVACWLSYTRGVPTAPRLVTFPSHYFETVIGLIDTASESSKQEHSTINRPERVIAGLFGLGMAAIGPLLWFILPPGDGQLIALYAGAMFGLLGVVLLWYGYSA